MPPPRRNRISAEFTVGGRRVRRRDGYFDLWQDRFVRWAEGRRVWALSGPTGSGKGVVLRARQALTTQRKGLIITPNTVTFGSLRRPLHLRLRDGQMIDWEPRLVIAPPNTTDQLINFLDDERTTERGTVICTNQTANYTFRALRDNGRLDLLHGLETSIDEIHWSDEEEKNRINEFLTYLIEHGRGNVGVATATWNRHNLHQILPHADLFRANFFTYPMHEYLAGMRFLRRIIVGFMFGTPEQVLRQHLDDGLQRLITWFPQPNSRFATGTKFEQLESLLRICGPFTQGTRDPFRHHLRRHNGHTQRIRSLDWVDDSDDDARKLREEQHLELLDTYPPDVMFCLRKGLEAYDDSTLQRGLMLGARESLVIRMQSLGRLLRDAEGKEWISYYTVVPPITDRDEARNYLVDIVVSMCSFGWRIRPASITYDAPKDEESVRPTGGRPVTTPEPQGEEEEEDEPPYDDRREGVDVDAAVRGAMNEHLRNPRVNFREILRNVLQDQNQSAYTDELLDQLSQVSRAVSSAEMPHGVHFDQNIEGDIERFCTVITSQTLLSVRASHGYDLGLTRTQIETAIWRHYQETGRWPNERTPGAVAGHTNLTWWQMAGGSDQLGHRFEVLVDSVRERRVGRSRRSSG